jgi:hypothetical protein
MILWPADFWNTEGHGKNREHGNTRNDTESLSPVERIERVVQALDVLRIGTPFPCVSVSGFFRVIPCSKDSFTL